MKFKFLRRLKPWESIPIGIGLALGVLGTIGIPERLGWMSSQQVIIALLSLILGGIVYFYAKYSEDVDKDLRNIASDLRRYVHQLTGSGRGSLDAIILRRGDRVDARKHLLVDDVSRPDVE